MIDVFRGICTVVSKVDSCRKSQSLQCDSYYNYEIILKNMTDIILFTWLCP